MDLAACDQHGVPQTACVSRHVADVVRAETARADGCEALLQAALTEASRSAHEVDVLSAALLRARAVLAVLRDEHPELVAAAETRADGV